MTVSFEPGPVQIPERVLAPFEAGRGTEATAYWPKVPGHRPRWAWHAMSILSIRGTARQALSQLLEHSGACAVALLPADLPLKEAWLGGPVWAMSSTANLGLHAHGLTKQGSLCTPWRRLANSFGGQWPNHGPKANSSTRVASRRLQKPWR